MSRVDYSELDAMLIARIEECPCDFTSLSSRKFTEVADKLAKPDPFGNRTGWRVVDRRLQALRKAGRIYFSHATRKWRMEEYK